jgi:hypothetical protein
MTDGCFLLGQVSVKIEPNKDQYVSDLADKATVDICNELFVVPAGAEKTVREILLRYLRESAGLNN